MPPRNELLARLLAPDLWKSGRGTGGRNRAAQVRRGAPRNELLSAILDPEFWGRDVTNRASQAAQGMAAGALGAPVDLVTAVLRPFGYSQPQKNVVGSGDWWGDKMGADVNSISYRAGEFGPIPDATDVLRWAANIDPNMVAALAGMTAYHGSPHKWNPEKLVELPDGSQKWVDLADDIPGAKTIQEAPLGRFRMDKIGTGEGAQAYGHGGYFAESAETGKIYQQQVKDVAMLDRNNRRMSELAKVMESDSVPGQYRKFRTDAGRKAAEEYDILMAEKMQPGHLYEADIPDEAINKMLDWDKPLSEQPESVRKALSDHFGRLGLDWSNSPYVTGGEFYKSLGSHKALPPEFRGKDDKGASDFLNSLGIPGIKYLDAGSRATSGGEILGAFNEGGKWKSKVKVQNRGGVGFSAPTDMITTSPAFNTEAEAIEWANKQVQKGTRNFVVFDESIVKVLDRK